MIISFGDSVTKLIFQGKRSKKLPPSIHRVAMRKLWLLNAAVELHDLKVPPGNRLEKLAGNYVGYHSIRINDQWRICFIWRDKNAHNVCIVDYH